MTEIENIVVVIPNWEKYQPKRNAKANSWFRFSHNVLYDDRFSDFTPGEWKMFLHCLSVASRRNQGRINLALSRCRQVLGLRSSCIISALNKLKRNECIEFYEDESGKEIAPYRQTDRQTDKSLKSGAGRHEDTDVSGEEGKRPGEVIDSELMRAQKRLLDLRASLRGAG